MSKRRSLQKQYPAALPVNVVPLPELYVFNPVSVAYFIYSYLFPTAPASLHCSGELSSCSSYVKVFEENDCNILWSMGFFGKGIYSRSEPSWWARTSRRLGLNNNSRLTAEEVTQARRVQRLMFKAERAKGENLELERRKLVDLGKNEEAEALAAEIAAINDNNERLAHSNDLSPLLKGFVRPEDEAFLVDGKLPQLEFLQLMPVEAFFLAHSLDMLQVCDASGHRLDSVSLFVELQAHNKNFAAWFAAYYYYRSLGWCVRSGVKFGTDFVLYRKGPPFSHAEFCVKLMLDDEEDQPWWWNTCTGRVVGGVKKTLVFIYVKSPPARLPQTREEIDDYISEFSVREVVYRRWIPGRNRD